MRILLAADHNGYEYKQKLLAVLKKSGYEVVDLSASPPKPDDDFPLFASQLVHELLADKDVNVKGILICGSGQGMCMAANRFKGIRASLCWNVEEARASRNDDDSNVLCLTARYLPLEETETIVHAWLNTAFAGAARFKRRIEQLDQIAP